MMLEISGLDPDVQELFERTGLTGVFLGRVIRSDGVRCRVITNDGEVEARAGTKMLDGPEGVPVVGDWVVLKDYEGTTMAVMVLPRRSRLSRGASGREVREQVIASNLDTVLIVMGLDGDLNIRRLERYLVMVGSSGASAVIILNKSDLVDDIGPFLDVVSEISGTTPIVAISARTGEGIDGLAPYLCPGKTLCLVGSSGSGKSTLINRLMGEDLQRTNEVGFDSKGRHTTTSREMFLSPSGALMIDNPGIRELQLWADGDGLDSAFEEIASLSRSCRFKDCSHLSEPGCAVLAALEDGSIARERYDSYQKLRREIGHTIARKDRSAGSAERKRWRSLTKDIKHYYRYKRTR